ncbi:MAG: two-component system sensor histidine kinase NtrB [Bacillota bacterium]
MDIPLRILIVEGSEGDSALQLKGIHSSGYTQIFQRAVTENDLFEALKTETWDIVVVDITTDQFTEQTVLNIIEESGIDLPCVIISETTGNGRKVKTIKHGRQQEVRQSLNPLLDSVKNEIHEAMLNNMINHTETSLSDQKEWFRITLASIGDAVITTDTTGAITFMNPVAEDLTGFTMKEAKGKHISHVFRIFNELTLEPTEIPVDRVLKEGFTIGLANHTGLITKYGETRSIADSAAPIRRQNGEIIGVVMVFRDITETKRMEEEMMRLDKLNVVGQMAAGIAHEIRNPMTTVHGFLQLLKTNPDFTEYADYFDVMIDELKRANSIITGFLSLTKDKTSEVQQQNLNRIINSIAPIMQAEAIMTNKYIQLELGEISDLLLNQNDIRQLILNLVRNALEASPPDSGVLIKSFSQNGKVYLTVKDNGTGIKKDILDKLGTPFFTTKETGTGLGLTICYRIAEKHNASIEIETGDEGTTFSVCFNKE